MIEFGKIPPQAIDMEEAVLGAVLIDKDAAMTAVSILKPEMFYKNGNQVLFAAVTELVNLGQPVDMLTVIDKLRTKVQLEPVGGPVYIAGLTSKIMSGANVEFHANVVKQKYILREYIRVGGEIVSKAFEDDLDEVVRIAEDGLLNITGRIATKEPLLVGDIVEGNLIQLQKIISHEIKLVGVPSGLITLDRSTGGFKPSEYIVLGGRPSQGKTGLALQFCLNAASIGYPCCLFSLEMGNSEIGRRVLSNYSGKSNMQLINGEVNYDEVLMSAKPVYSLPFWIDDSAAITLMELRAKTRKMILRHNIKMIVVDYIGLMNGEGYSRENELSKISAGLKAIAKDFDIPVIALSQLSRKVMDRADKKPVLSDLRDSGSIEQDADMVIFVMDPHKMGEVNVDINGSLIDSSNVTMLLLSKNRNGAVKDIPLWHNEFYTEFKDYENEAPY